MRPPKIVYLLTLSISLFFSCNSTKNLVVPDGSLNGPNISAKSGGFTAEQMISWGHADIMTDTIAGISLDKAYAFLKGKKSNPVIVAVADTGLDTDHEDLKDVLWVNEKEQANGKDDDNNGFVDDIHGWNFLGDTYNENLEMTRMVRNFNKRFGDKKEGEIAATEKEDFQLFKKLEKMVKNNYAGSGYYYNLAFNAREGQPDPYDYAVKVYGNNKVKNSISGEAHASHVAGIIGATRDNQKGMNGIANNVKIMSLRLVPAGDEYDKDVALGIKYAADQGAKILNASFGKSYSPKREWVYDAIKYAAEKDMLIVMSSGNAGQDIDVMPNFPNDTPNDDRVEFTDNVITVGANTPYYNESLPASFSNYGKENVDVFAPGVNILSTVPGSRYRPMGGTSMAAPAVAGVAALLRSYYPELTASQVKQIIMNSGSKIDFKVMKPGGNPEMVPFTDLCKSGRVLNAYQAVKMADQMLNKK
jgi:subtilisin family serine protease